MGAFYGIFVNKDTDPEIIKILTDAYTKAGNDENFKAKLLNQKIKFLGLTGQKADEYISSWRSNTIDALITGGFEGLTDGFDGLPDYPANITPPVKNVKVAQNNKPRKNSQDKNENENKNENKNTSAKKINYPTREISGIIQWGKGGATDALTREVTNIVAKNTGWKINLQNVTGDTGFNGFKQVYDSPADGYTLLMGAENPSIYDALEIDELTYKDFDCIYLIGYVAPGVMVAPNSRFNTLTDLIEEARVNPGTIKLAYTGKGGVGWVVNAFFSEITGAKFQLVPYNSGTAAKNAVIKGECDFTICLLQEGIEDSKKGDVRFLSLFTFDEDPDFPGVPTITNEYPGFFQYLPWGAFYGVHVKKGIDPEILNILMDEYQKAGNNKEFQNMLKKYKVIPLGYSGLEAAKYIYTWRENTVDALVTSGAEGVTNVPTDILKTAKECRTSRRLSE